MAEGYPDIDPSKIAWDMMPCGCRIGEQMTPAGGAFVMDPCDTTCEMYQYALAETARQGKPIVFQEEP